MSPATTRGPVLRVTDLVKHFPVRHSKDVVHAVNNVSFEIQAGETLALVGESGSGKTTVGRCVLKLEDPTSGVIEFGGQDITKFSRRDFRKLRPRIQMVFQEPYDSLNPRFSVEDTLGENIQLEGILSAPKRKQRISEVLGLVHLPHRVLEAYPHELTSSEQQRVSVARALSTGPDVLVLDEPTSALDITVRAEIISLLKQLQHETNVAYLFISHDMTAVKELAHRMAVMYLGEIVEVGPNPEIFTYQLHPYAKALLSSVLLPDPGAALGQVLLRDEIPSPVRLPTGCYLHPRCPFALPICVTDKPAFLTYPASRAASCHRSGEFVPSAHKASVEQDVKHD